MPPPADREADLVEHAVNVLALVKDSERFVFLFDDESPDELFRTLARYAADDELSFTWYDAAVLSQRVRKLIRQNDETRPAARPVNRLPEAA